MSPLKKEVGMLTVVEWNALSNEDRETRKEEMPEELKKKDDRSFQNIAAEERRKREAAEKRAQELEEENAAFKESLNNPYRRTNDNTSEQFSKIAQMAEDEMARTGRTVPVETIVRMINQGAMHIAGQLHQSQSKANGIRRKAKQNLRTKYKEFSKFEDEFDEATDSLNPSNVTEEGLEIIFNSIRGKHSDELEKEIEERIRKKYESNPLIVGPDTGSGSGQRGSAPTKLTSAQSKEMVDMNIDSEDTYLNLLKRKQDRAKAIGSKKIPLLLSESIH